MDTRVYGRNLGTLIQTRLTHGLAVEFVNKILDGTVTGYSLSSFFQEDSDYIVGITYYPIRTDLFITGQITTLQTVTIGSKLATLSDYTKEIVTYANFISLGSVTINKQFNNFLDYEPYTKVRLYVPYFEIIDLPMEECYGKAVDLFLAMDFTTGKGTLYVYTNMGANLITSKTAQIGIKLPLGKTNAQEQQRNKILNGIDAFTGFGGLVLGAETGSGVVTGGSVGMIGRTIKNELNNNVSRLKSYHGGMGGFDMLAVDKTCYVIIESPKNITYPNRSIKGGVCKQNKTLSAISGYTEIGEIHFNPSGYEIMDDEISEVIDLLHTGVIL